MLRDTLTAGAYLYVIELLLLSASVTVIYYTLAWYLNLEVIKEPVGPHVWTEVDACTSLSSLCVVVGWTWWKRVLEQVRYEGTKK